MSDLIFGKTWEEIQVMQQKRYVANRAFVHNIPQDFAPTHYDTLRKSGVQVTPTEFGNSFLWPDGSTGHDPGLLSSRFIEVNLFRKPRV